MPVGVEGFTCYVGISEMMKGGNEMSTQIMGIYKITNLISNKIYIGSSKDIPKRWKQHISGLNNNKHCNFHLQRSWNKYGESSFKFEIVDIVSDQNDLFTSEQKWIDDTKCCDGNIGYNLSRDVNAPNQAKMDIIQHLNCNLVYRDFVTELINMQLEVNEKLVYYVLRDFTVFPSNSIMINDKVPTFEELEPILGLKERTIRKAVKALELKGLFKLKQSGHKKVIYVNPEYYATGKNLDIDTVKMFDLM